MTKREEELKEIKYAINVIIEYLLRPTGENSYLDHYFLKKAFNLRALIDDLSFFKSEVSEDEDD